MGATKKVTEKSDRLVFAEVLEKLQVSIDKLLSQVGEVEDFKREKLLEFELLRETKNKDILDLEVKFKELNEKLNREFTTLHKTRQIECDQAIDEYKNEAITKFLTERSEVAVLQSEWDRVQSELQQLRDGNETSMSELRTTLESQNKKAISAITHNLELQHKASTASLQASVQQKDNDIKTLAATIDNLKNEIAAQRDLTSQIAQSMKQAPITQTFTK